jgi:hypothetical protein
MKIVIDIPKHIYEHAKEQSEDSYDEWDAMRAIANGTPLPEHHGRLIDADAFITKLEDASKRQKYNELLIYDCLTVDDVFKAVIGSLLNDGLAENDTPTIIEADKESDNNET